MRVPANNLLNTWDIRISQLMLRGHMQHDAGVPLAALRRSPHDVLHSHVLLGAGTKCIPRIFILGVAKVLVMFYIHSCTGAEHDTCDLSR